MPQRQLRMPTKNVTKKERVEEARSVPPVMLLEFA